MASRSRMSSSLDVWPMDNSPKDSGRRWSGRSCIFARVQREVNSEMLGLTIMERGIHVDRRLVLGAEGLVRDRLDNDGFAILVRNGVEYVAFGE